jgi:flagellar hook-length control protein FliK
VKTAAPQAPGSSLHSAKTRSKGMPVPAKSAGAAAFAGALAKAVAAKGRGAQAAARMTAEEPAARNPKGGAPRGTTSGRDGARSAARRRVDEAPSVAQTSAETMRTAASGQLPAAAPPTDRGTAGPAGARRAEPRIQVVDLRTKPAAAEKALAERAGAKIPAEKSDGLAVTAKPFSERLAAAGTDAPAPAPARATPLARIREMTGSDLVRSVGLLVRDGGGEIRLTLKPESLGSVRIRLSLEDGRIEGKIVVDTPEARQAFEAGIDSLTRALQADGFQTGSLSVSVSGGNANDSRQAAGLLGDAISGARTRASDDALQAAVPLAEWNGGGDGLVNVFA